MKNDIISREPFPASRKVYVPGQTYPVQVAMREITLTGPNAPVTVYDTSGPYTDPAIGLDVHQGLPRLR
ncbi:MAG TPA: phosphomethylpyrimidine synthase ThiC, partial [Puia sp.]